MKGRLRKINLGLWENWSIFFTLFSSNLLSPGWFQSPGAGTRVLPPRSPQLNFLKKVDAERWIVNLIRTYRIEGAKIDSQSGQVVMGAKPISIHEQVMENTKRMSVNGWFVCQFPFFLLGLFVRSRWPCSLKNWNRTAERSASTQENLIFLGGF